MPVALRQGGLRYYFFSNEAQPPEPAHIHVKGGGRDAKIWLEPTISIIIVAIGLAAYRCDDAGARESVAIGV